MNRRTMKMGWAIVAFTVHVALFGMAGAARSAALPLEPSKKLEKPVSAHIGWGEAQDGLQLGLFPQGIKSRSTTVTHWRSHFTPPCSPFWCGRATSRRMRGVTPPNPASVGLHIAMGFEPVGIHRGVGYKMGVWHDVGWYALSLQPQRADPDPHRSVHEALTTSD